MALLPPPTTVDDIRELRKRAVLTSVAEGALGAPSSVPRGVGDPRAVASSRKHEASLTGEILALADRRRELGRVTDATRARERTDRAADPLAGAALGGPFAAWGAGIPESGTAVDSPPPGRHVRATAGASSRSASALAVRAGSSPTLGRSASPGAPAPRRGRAEHLHASSSQVSTFLSFPVPQEPLERGPRTKSPRPRRRTHRPRMGPEPEPTEPGTIGRTLPHVLLFHRFAAVPLSMLDLSGWSNHVTDDTLELLAGSVAPSLTALNLSHSHRWKEGAMLKLVARLQTLRVAAFDSCPGLTDDVLTAIVRRSPQMKALSLAACDRLTADGLVATSRALSASLEYLSVRGCRNMSGVGIAAIAHSCTRLLGLSAGSGPVIDEAACQEIGRLRQLEVLHLSDSISLTDKGLELMFAFTTSLRLLHLARCERLTDEGLRFLQETRMAWGPDTSKRFPRLTSVDVSGCLQLSDMAVNFIAGPAERLEEIDLSSCPSLDDDSLRALGSLAHLHTLRLVDCEHITDRGLALLFGPLAEELYGRADPSAGGLLPSPEDDRKRDRRRRDANDGSRTRSEDIGDVDDETDALGLARRRMLAVDRASSNGPTSPISPSAPHPTEDTLTFYTGSASQGLHFRGRRSADEAASLTRGAASRSVSPSVSPSRRGISFSRSAGGGDDDDDDDGHDNSDGGVEGSRHDELGGAAGGGGALHKRVGARAGAGSRLGPSRLQLRKEAHTAAILRSVDRKPSKLGQSLHVLDLIGLHGLSDVGLRLIARFANALRALAVSNCDFVTDAGVRVLARAYCVPSLERLVLRDMPAAVTAASIAPLLENARRLRHLDLSGAGAVGDAAFASLQFSRTIESVDLSRCKLVTDHALRSMPYTLKHLWAAHLPRVTDVGVRSVLLQGRHLRLLDVTGCAQLTNLAVARLARRKRPICPHLHTLNVTHCPRISDECLRAILASRPDRGLCFLQGTRAKPAPAGGSAEPWGVGDLLQVPVFGIFPPATTAGVAGGDFSLTFDRAAVSSDSELDDSDRGGSTSPPRRRARDRRPDRDLPDVFRPCARGPFALVQVPFGSDPSSASPSMSSSSSPSSSSSSPIPTSLFGGDDAAVRFEFARVARWGTPEDAGGFVWRPTRFPAEALRGHLSVTAYVDHMRTVYGADFPSASEVHDLLHPPPRRGSFARVGTEADDDATSVQVLVPDERVGVDESEEIFPDPNARLPLHTPEVSIWAWLPWARPALEARRRSVTFSLLEDADVKEDIVARSGPLAARFGSRHTGEYTPWLEGAGDRLALPPFEVELASGFRGLTWDARLLGRAFRHRFRRARDAEQKAAATLQRFWRDVSTRKARRTIWELFWSARQRGACALQTVWRQYRARRRWLRYLFASRFVVHWLTWRFIWRRKNKLERRADRHYTRTLARKILRPLAGFAAHQLRRRAEPFSFCHAGPVSRAFHRRHVLEEAWRSLLRWWRACVTMNRLSNRASRFYSGNFLRFHFLRWRGTAQRQRHHRARLIAVFLNAVGLETRNALVLQGRRQEAERRGRRMMLRRAFARLRFAWRLGQARHVRARVSFLRRALVSDGRRAWDGFCEGVAYWKHFRLASEKAEVLGRLAVERHAFTRYLEFHRLAQWTRRAEADADALRTQTLTRRTFRSWDRFRTRSKELKATLKFSLDRRDTRWSHAIVDALRAHRDEMRHLKHMLQEARRLFDTNRKRKAVRAWTTSLTTERRLVGRAASLLTRWHRWHAFHNWHDGARLVRKEFEDELSGFTRQMRAATRIQAWFRAAAEKARFFVRLTRSRRAALLVQCAWRGRVAKRIARRLMGVKRAHDFWELERRRLRLEREDEESRRLERWWKAATKIQEGYRRHREFELAKLSIRLIQRERARKQRERQEAIRKADRLRRFREASFREAAELAALTIQRCFRGFRERALLCELIYRKKVTEAATRIQRIFRMRRGARLAHATRRARDDDREHLRRRRGEGRLLRALGAADRESQAKLRADLDDAIGLNPSRVNTLLAQVATEVWRDAQEALATALWWVKSTFALAPTTRERDRIRGELELDREAAVLPRYGPGDAVRIVEPNHPARGQTGLVLHMTPFVRFGGRGTVKLDRDGSIVTVPLTFGGTSDADCFDSLWPLAAATTSPAVAPLSVSDNRGQLVLQNVVHVAQFAEDQRRHAAATDIQRVFRGYRGRQRFDRIQARETDLFSARDVVAAAHGRAALGRLAGEEPEDAPRTCTAQLREGAGAFVHRLGATCRRSRRTQGDVTYEAELDALAHAGALPEGTLGLLFCPRGTVRRWAKHMREERWGREMDHIEQARELWVQQMLGRAAAGEDDRPPFLLRDTQGRLFATLAQWRARQGGRALLAQLPAPSPHAEPSETAFGADSAGDPQPPVPREVGGERPELPSADAGVESQTDAAGVAAHGYGGPPDRVVVDVSAVEGRRSDMGDGSPSSPVGANAAAGALMPSVAAPEPAESAEPSEPSEPSEPAAADDSAAGAAPMPTEIPITPLPAAAFFGLNAALLGFHGLERPLHEYKAEELDLVAAMPRKDDFGLLLPADPVEKLHELYTILGLEGQFGSHILSEVDESTEEGSGDPAGTHAGADGRDWDFSSFSTSEGSSAPRSPFDAWPEHTFRYQQPPELLFTRWRSATRWSRTLDRARAAWQSWVAGPLARRQLAAAARPSWLDRRDSAGDLDREPLARTPASSESGPDSVSPVRLRSLRDLSLLADLVDVPASAAWLGGREWLEAPVARRTWIGRYRMPDLAHFRQVRAAAHVVYHGEWARDAASGEFVPHGRGFAHFLVDHPRFNATFLRSADFWDRFRRTVARSLEAQRERALGTSAQTALHRRRLLSTCNVLLSTALEARREAEAIGMEPDALILEVLHDYVAEMRAEGAEDRVRVARKDAEEQRLAGEVEDIADPLVKFDLRAQFARAVEKRQRWIALREEAREEELAEAVRRVEEAMHTELGADLNLIRCSWGQRLEPPRERLSARTRLRRRVQSLRAASRVSRRTPRAVGLENASFAQQSAIACVASADLWWRDSVERCLRPHPDSLYRTLAHDARIFEQIEGEFRHGVVGGIVRLWFRDGSLYLGPFVAVPSTDDAWDPDEALRQEREMEAALSARPSLEPAEHAAFFARLAGLPSLELGAGDAGAAQLNPDGNRGSRPASAVSFAVGDDDDRVHRSGSVVDILVIPDAAPEAGPSTARPEALATARPDTAEGRPAATEGHPSITHSSSMRSGSTTRGSRRTLLEDAEAVVLPGVPRRVRRPDHWGVLAMPDGWFFEGPSVDNFFDPKSATGLVHALSPDGTSYTGFLRHGHRHGRGDMRYADGSHFSGYWVDGAPFGEGELVRGDGGSLRAVFQRNGKTEGLACDIRGPVPVSGPWSPGHFGSSSAAPESSSSAPLAPSQFGAVANMFVGQFRDGLREGFGIAIGPVRPAEGTGGVPLWNALEGAQMLEVFAGQFRAGKPHGLGIQVGVDGSIYWGEWRDGLRHGTGVWEWPSGERYEGMFRDGLRHGDAVEANSFTIAPSVERAVAAEVRRRQGLASEPDAAPAAASATAVPAGTAASATATAQAPVDGAEGDHSSVPSAPVNPESGTTVETASALELSAAASEEVHGMETVSIYGNSLGVVSPEHLTPFGRRLLEALPSFSLEAIGRPPTADPANPWAPQHVLSTLAALAARMRRVLGTAFLSAQSRPGSPASRPGSSMGGTVRPGSPQSARRPVTQRSRRAKMDRVSHEVETLVLERIRVRLGRAANNYAGELRLERRQRTLWDRDRRVAFHQELFSPVATLEFKLTFPLSVPLPRKTLRDWRHPEMEAHPDEQERTARSVWLGPEAFLVAASLPFLPPGVDPADPAVQFIVRRILRANLPIAATQGITLAKERLLAAAANLTKTATRREVLVRQDDILVSGLAQVTDEQQGKARAVRDLKTRFYDLRDRLDKHWNEDDTERTLSEYGLALRALHALPTAAWEELLREKSPFVGWRKPLQSLLRSISIITLTSERWEDVSLWFADSARNRLHEVDVPPNVQFRVRLLHALDHRLVTPFSFGQRTDALEELGNLIVSSPDFEPAQIASTRLPVALKVLARWVRAFHRHAARSTPVFGLWQEFVALEERVAEAEVVERECHARLDRAARDLQDARDEIAHLVRVEDGERDLIARQVAMVQEAREILRLWHGDDGMIALDEAPPVVPPSILPPPVRRGLPGLQEGYFPPLRPKDQDEVDSRWNDVYANQWWWAGGDWMEQFDEATGEVYYENAGTGDAFWATEVDYMTTEPAVDAPWILGGSTDWANAEVVPDSAPASRPRSRASTLEPRLGRRPAHDPERNISLEELRSRIRARAAARQWKRPTDAPGPIEASAGGGLVLSLGRLHFRDGRPLHGADDEDE